MTNEHVHETRTEIEQLLSSLTSGERTVDTRASAVRLAQLIEVRDRRHERAMRHAESAMSSLQAVLGPLHRALTDDELAAQVCSGATALADGRRCMFSRLDGLRVEPLSIAPDGQLPAPYDLPDDLTIDAGLPVVFTHLSHSVFRIDLNGRPTGLIHVHANLTPSTVDAMHTFAVMVGTALECAALDARRDRQSELLHAMWDGRKSIRDIENPAGTEPVTAAESSADESLTRREREVLALVLTGASNSTIATEFVISVETVRSHVKRLLKKCGVSNRAELIARFDTPTT